MDDRAASPDFWSQILFRPVHGTDFGTDSYLVRYVVRILVWIFLGPVRGPEFGPKIRSGTDNPDQNPYHVPDEVRVRTKLRATYRTEKNPDQKSGPGSVRISGTVWSSMRLLRLEKCGISINLI